jgi:NADPH2:quinone reductase
MKAIRVSRFGGPEVLSLEDVELGDPGPDEVRLRVGAAGVNPYDTYMRAGAYGARNPQLPYTPGSDAAGTIESLAPGSPFKVGDRVYTTGTVSGAYAEMAIVKAEDVHPLPDRVSFPQGAGVYVPFATAYRALFQLAHARAGETLLVHGGSGGTGIATIQWGVAAGLRVLGTAGSEPGLDLIRKQGCEHAFDHTSEDHPRRILEATEGRGVDVIVEMLANKNLDHDLKMLAHRGRVVIVGSRGDVQITPRDLMSREASVMGVLLWSVPARERGEIHAAVQAGLRTGTLQPVVGHEMPLSAAAEAHRRVMEPGALGKIALIP